MKKASELGLELIELEDQVLLVDENTVFESGDWAIHRHDWYREKYKQIPIRVNKSNKLSIQEHWCKIIASTKPLEGLPLLVIEDEEESEYYKTHGKAGFGDYDDFPTFKEGYNKAKEKFKFTEEDLRKALWELGDVLFNNNQNGIKEGEPELYFDTIIQSLTKKELWVEVDCTLVGLDLSDNCQPKITNNQIKAVWK